ncbi:DUF2785 domain-containing protein [Streptomyces sp. JH14]|uniref:DUF2785 domain-containing protein n=1 Tax=Streptomyces sp. JH14 TaxID=2793630 RepID=UPI0023F6C83F|nr:DUF2785 domain-containing protein [Streptomyces sp. JH14]MDF6044597.1 DUF2785 domain-containing protein [Streptomyces sp. JH14]
MDTSQSRETDIRRLQGPPRAAALDGLITDLRSPDPVVRDDLAYRTARRWVPVLEPSELRYVGDRMAAHFASPAIQARTFAPLVLALIADGGEWKQEWWSAFADWFPAETDLRGHDPELGWLHAPAHGADLLAALSRHPRQDPYPLAELAVSRLLAATDHLFDAQEDDRLAFALAQILGHPGLTTAQSAQWLDPVAAAFRTGEPGPVPAWASNTMRTLRMLYILADRGFRGPGAEALRTPTHRAVVLDSLAETLAIVAPYAG